MCVCVGGGVRVRVQDLVICVFQIFFSLDGVDKLASLRELSLAGNNIIE